ncbi:hypothetical protein F4679DRAFT_557289 [Xylaria curta]|nr:hypothetical protein F4679DRAFT_557289 [Xylaria curta]
MDESQVAFSVTRIGLPGSYIVLGERNPLTRWTVGQPFLHELITPSFTTSVTKLLFAAGPQGTQEERTESAFLDTDNVTKSEFAYGYHVPPWRDPEVWESLPDVFIIDLDNEVEALDECKCSCCGD